ncbi:hypothetical protein FOB20_13910 [Acinetobacter lwoffii]|uniref:hypothetical protein n=1 Tax=Acinetobacter lwoffii TaxID=28090 RepID=UPI001581767F|nr:hypothetical protein [Acinetobacter lwoffii]QKT99758.1 hypothetical protein FOB20_13910 [Acinetobacter lwoffii]
MDIQKEREAFENHLKKMGKTDNETFSKDEDDSYQMDVIHFGWKIWQAATSRMEVRINTLDEMLLNQGEALAQAKAQAVPEWTEYEMKSPRIDGRYQIFIDGEQIAADWECGFGFSCPISGEALIQQKITHWSVLGGDPKEPTNEL